MMLRCVSLQFSYGPCPVLHDVSFEVEPGSLCAILGRNGSGKTTLLHCLNGILDPQGGRIEQGDTDLARLSQFERARRMSMVPQEHAEAFPFAVRDLVVMGRTPYLKPFQVPQAADYALAMEALALLGAEGLADRNFNQISGGERQLALLARALVQSAQTLLLDEPTNHLDFKNQYLLLERVKGLCRSRGTKALASMHDPNMAALFADHVVMLKHGRVLAQGAVDEVMTAEAVSELYDAPTRLVPVEGGGRLFMPSSVL